MTNIRGVRKIINNKQQGVYKCEQQNPENGC